jgi:uncharacterized protein YdiU (UPF0061 family)
MTMHFPFDNTYARLPDRFFARVAPTPVAAPRLVRLNRELALELRLDPDWLASSEAVEILAGKRVPDAADPIAMAYAGHQFGHFVPQLGDGRAILLGEVVDRNGVRRDIQLKGSGRTPFSRNGDGRAALGPVLREYVVSEAMAALGVATTRSLAAVITGETVTRNTLLPGAVLTRVASSHIRIGTFQFFAARGDTEGVRLLADHVIARHYPEAAEAEHSYRTLLHLVIACQAFTARFEAAFHAGMRKKLGLFTERESDLALIRDLLTAMAENQADFTLTFRRLSDAAATPDEDEAVGRLFANRSAYDEWATRWRQRLGEEPKDGATRRAAMRAVNPAFIPRNHRVENVIEAAEQHNDFGPFEELLTVLSRPFEDQPAFAHYVKPPEPHERVHQTFCGT